MGKMTLDPKNPPRMTAEERARQAGMTEADIEAAAVADEDNPPLSADELRRVKAARLAKEARKLAGMSQSEFAEAYGIKVARVRDLEQARREPDGALVAYLKVIRKDPKFVREALRNSP